MNINDRNPVQRPAVRIGTLVWGSVLILIGVLLSVAQLTAVRLDPRAVVIGILLLAGIALLIGGVVSALGRARKKRRESADTVEA
ncbi:hypothetical protein [Psychromicrobium sp. YIM B11713]|uniref:hypothetical protein n=1 Tax=Psychromicrobium sp. YIM B11713 TaxID=3145233 RepID=UPI00374ED659